MAELLRQVAPRVTRAAVLRDPVNPSAIAQFGVIQAVRRRLDWKSFRSTWATLAPSSAPRDTSGFSDGRPDLTSPGRGNFSVTHIMKLAAQHKVARVCPYRNMVTDGA